MVPREVKKIIDEIEKLPTLPVVANKVTALLQDPTCTAIRVSEVIDKDQSLSTRVLRLVNSSYYSMSTDVTNVRHAIALLGFKTISQLVISISVFDVFRGTEGKGFDREGFWKHSIGCAVISQMIAQLAQYPKADDCFTAGLLHDVGKVVVDQFLHEEMEAIIKLTRESDMCFTDAESQTMGLNHADIGGRVLHNWNIPVPIVACAKHHHQQLLERKNGAYSQDLIVDIVRLADTLCRRKHIGYTGDDIVPELHEELWERLNITSSLLEELNNYCDEEVERASDLLKLA